MSNRLKLLILLLAWAAILSGVSWLQFELRPYDIQDSSFPESQELADSKESFKDGNSALVIFASATTLTRPQICSLLQWTEDFANGSSEVQFVFNPLDIRQPSREDDKLWYRKVFENYCEGSAQDPHVYFAQSPWQGLFLDDDKKQFGVEFSFRDSVEQRRFGSFDPKPIGDMYASAKAWVNQKELPTEVYIGGRSSFQWHIKEVLRKDAWVNVAILIVFLIFFRVFFGTWTSGFLYTASLVFSMGATFGLMGWFGFKYDLLINNLFLMTAIAGVEDFLFLSHGQMRWDGRSEEPFKWYARPGFFTTLTTTLGFFSLLVSDFPTIQNFGLWAGIASLLEWVSVFVFLRLTIAAFPRLSLWTNNQRAIKLKIFERAFNLTPPPYAIALSLILFISGLISFAFLRFHDSPESNFPKNHLNTRSYELLKESRGWAGSVQLVFDQARPNKDDLNNIAKTLSEVQILPNVALIESPAKVIEHYTKSLSDKDQNLVIDEMKQWSLKRYFSQDGQARSFIYLKELTSDALSSTIRDLKKICGSRCRPVGELVVYQAFSEKIIANLVEGFALSLLMVGLALFFILQGHSLWQRSKIIYSALWGPVATLPFLVALDLPINIITSIFAAAIVGLTGDNAIFYALSHRKGKLDQNVYDHSEASLLLTLLLLISSLLFFGMTLRPAQNLGLMFLIAFSLNIFGDLWILKGLLVERPKS